MHSLIQLTHCRVERIAHVDHTWVFTLDNNATISTESTWRVSSVDGIRVASDDDGHSFGLNEPVDSVTLAMNAVGHVLISAASIRERSGDLVISFSNNMSLEFLNLSCGYEAWRFKDGERELFSLGGGILHEVGLMSAEKGE